MALLTRSPFPLLGAYRGQERLALGFSLNAVSMRSGLEKHLCRNLKNWIMPLALPFTSRKSLTFSKSQLSHLQLGSHTCLVYLKALLQGSNEIGAPTCARGPHAARDGCECGPTQNCKFTENIVRFLLRLCVTTYLMCGPRQLFFFQCGPEMPKGWTTPRPRSS